VYSCGRTTSHAGDLPEPDQKLVWAPHSETERNYVPMLSKPDFALDLIRQAAQAIQEA